ncbi:MAG: hypothetical protein RPS47_18055 [Colwellia sp.]|jgi:hypothetical protein
MDIDFKVVLFVAAFLVMMLINFFSHKPRLKCKLRDMSGEQLNELNMDASINPYSYRNPNNILHNTN